MKKWTQEPWRVFEPVAPRTTISGDQATTVTSDPDDSNSGFFIADFYGPDREANAKLAVAASDLAKALLEAVDHRSAVYVQKTDETAQRWIAALKKAGAI